MNIKKKIAVWCALFALLVALVPPSSAKANATETTADDVKYSDIEDFMHSAGYTSFVKNEGSLYLVSDTGTYWCVEEIQGVVDYNPFWLYDASRGSIWYFADISVNQTMCNYYNYYEPLEASNRDFFDVVNSGRNGYGTDNGVYWNGNNRYYAIDYGNENNVLYSDLDIYQVEPVTVGTTMYVKNTDNVYFESSVYGNFSFPVWCQYAGLNCLASSNESPTKIPYSYNSYWHIVRKTSSGKWLLTTVGNSVSQENASDYTFMYSEDMGSLQVFNLYSGEDVNGYLLNVRQYEYDTDGWKVRTYETYDARETDDCIIDLGAGSGVDQTRVLAYTNVNIYDQSFELVTSASTEYYEVTDTPTVTPEPTPDAGSGGDSSDTGGSGSDGGGTGGGTRPDDSIEDEETFWNKVTGALDDIKNMFSQDKNLNGSIGELTNTLVGIVELISVVPLMIGAVFGFLPEWCLVILGASFAFMGILIVIKLIRG